MYIFTYISIQYDLKNCGQYINIKDQDILSKSHTITL